MLKNRPRPKPLPLVVKKGFPIDSAMAAGTPGPWSRMLITMSWASQSRRTSRSSGQASAALFNRFSKAWVRSGGGARRGTLPWPRRWKR
ncbi:hypothetical protein D3C78_1583170 [compost metagenome]